jgi:DNA-binding SARP family transcriptional activator
METTPQGSARNAGSGRFQLKLLGVPTLEAEDGSALAGLGPGKSLAVLAYISVRGPARRDELISLLWGEIPEDKARNAFRQSLHRLRAVLGEDILPQDRDYVSLRDSGLLRSDREEFVHACESERWEDAVAAYRGEFLEGFETDEAAFDRWADAERVRLRSQFEEALRAAALDAASDGRTEDALRYAQRLTATAPYDEDAALFEANTLVAAGRPAQALALLRQFGERLAEDLDLPLPPSVRALAERLEKRSAREHQTPPGNHVTDRGRAAFVGRQGELARMLAAVTELKAERGATMLVDGDAGIGKSRLLDEFADRARNLGGVTILRGREVNLGGVVPYAGVAEALRPLSRAAGIAGASRHLLAEAARLLPELRDAFELPDTKPIEDETARLRFFEGVAALVDAAAYERPIVMMLDDAQHASPSTVDLIVYLARRLHESPVLLVIAFRGDRAATQGIDRLRELAGPDSGNIAVTLEALSTDESELLLRELTRGHPGVGPSDIARLARASRGRPFAVVEMSRRAITGEMPTEHVVPLRDVLWTRFQSCSPSQRRIFFAASLFDRSVDIRLLAAAAHLPETAAFEAVEQLVAAGLLRLVDGAYSVAHDSTTTFIVDASGLAGRALLAGWAAEALAATPGRSDAELASLYAMAGRPAEAFTHARRAAFTAAAMGASSEVTRLLGMALTFAPGDVERREIDSLLAAFGRTRLTLPAPPVASEPAPAEAVVESIEPPAVATPPGPAPAAEAPPVAARTRWQKATTRQWAVSIAISLGVILIGVVARREIQARRLRGEPIDTLYLTERDVGGRATLRYALGVARGDDNTSFDATRSLGPAWADSIRPPWTNPLPSPDGRYVALQRAAPRGAELFVIGADRRDTIVVARGDAENSALSWAPDSRALLISRTRTLPGGGVDADLFTASLTTPGRLLPVDTSAVRAVTEAEWSPNGELVAWVARTGENRQRDVFVSRPDGGGMRILSSSAADDHDIAWSPDGSLLAFTSERPGGARLAVYDLDNARLWPVSERGGETHAVFSPDSRTMAFESTREGDLAVYTRSALGGRARRITPAGRQFGIQSWHGGTPSYIDRLRIVGRTSLGIGDTLRPSLLALTPDGRQVTMTNVRWTVLDSGVVQTVPSAAGARDSAHIAVVGRAVGTARLVAMLPGWRADTVPVSVAPSQRLEIDDSFSGPALDSRWIPLGVPLPALGRTVDGTPGLFPNADLEWESGVLLRPTIELRPGLKVSAVLRAPFTGPSSQASLVIGLVPAVSTEGIDRTAPRFVPIVAAQWDGTSGNFAFSVGQESSTARVSAGASPSAHRIDIAFGNDRSIEFSIDGAVRWTTLSTFAGDLSDTPVQVWIGGRGTGQTVSVSSFHVELPPRAARR